LIFDSLVTHDGNDNTNSSSNNKHLWIKKATGLGISEFMLRFMAWLCLKDDALSGSQMCIVLQKAFNADLEVVNDALRTNLFGPWRLSQAFIPMMKTNRYGRIVNVSSLGGSLQYTNYGGTPAYSISKAALNMLTRKLAEELVNTGILVNSVDPGWVATDMGGRGGRPVQEGAKGIVWAATLPDDGPSGGFFCDGKAVPW
jgi:NAD(P)-dependent dehydrogenase (short-subunit alcohol dehydrogenase family)